VLQGQSTELIRCGSQIFCVKIKFTTKLICYIIYTYVNFFKKDDNCSVLRMLGELMIQWRII